MSEWLQRPGLACNAAVGTEAGLAPAIPSSSQSWWLWSSAGPPTWNTGSAQNLGLYATLGLLIKDFKSNHWVNLRILGYTPRIVPFRPERRG